VKSGTDPEVFVRGRSPWRGRGARTYNGVQGQSPWWGVRGEGGEAESFLALQRPTKPQNLLSFLFLLQSVHTHHDRGKKSLWFNTMHNCDKFKYIFIIVDKNHPDTSFN